jgi:NADH dehydrogenase (ubiquinone) 1 alpha subcomplex subunit 9
VSPIGIPIINKTQRLRPVYVGDVAKVLEHLIRDEEANGRVVELFGPREYYYENLVKLWLDTTRRSVTVTYPPKFLLRFMASALNRVVALPMITPDEIDRVYIYLTQLLVDCR